MGHRLMEACKDMERSELGGRGVRDGGGGGVKRHLLDWQKYTR